MAQKAFRATVYDIQSDAAGFSGAVYTLALKANLSPNYLALLRPSGIAAASPVDGAYAHVSADPFGTGELGTTTGAAELELTRVGTAGEWSGSVIILECLGDPEVSGFRLVDVLKVVTTSTADDVAKALTGAWVDLAQVTAHSVPLGGGAIVTATGTDGYQSGWSICQVQESPAQEVRIRRDGIGGPGLSTATFTVFVIEWGSEWTVQKVFGQSGSSNGGDGIDAIGEYDNFTIAPTPGPESLVLFSGALRANGLGDGIEGKAVVLGDGVSTIAIESKMSLGGEIPGQVFAAELICLQHPDLLVERLFGAQGTIGGIEDAKASGTKAVSPPLGPAEVYSTAGAVSSTQGYRVPILTNTHGATSNGYPKNLLRARHTAASLMTWERGTTGGDAAYWLQSADFFAIDRTDIADPVPLVIQVTIPAPTLVESRTLTPAALVVSSATPAPVVSQERIISPAPVSVQISTPPPAVVSVTHRATDYRIASSQISLQGYTLQLKQPLAPNFYIEVGRGSVTTIGKFTDQRNFRVTADPFVGHFATQTAADQIEISRFKAIPDVDAEITITVHECLNPGAADGFTLRGVFELLMPDQVSTASANHSGVIDPNQCQAILGGLQSENAVNWQQNAACARLQHDATTISIERDAPQYDYLSVQATAFLIEWGPAVTVQKVDFDNTLLVGGDLSTPAQWLTVPVASVNTDKSFTTASFFSKGVSNSGAYALNIAHVFGDGVTIPANATTIAIGEPVGGQATKGTIYVVTCALWHVSHQISPFGSVIQNNSQAEVFSTIPASVPGVYDSSGSVERASGQRVVRLQTAAEGSVPDYAYASVIATSDDSISWHRGTSSFAAGSARALAVISVVDFAGSPFGDINSIDGAKSTADIGQLGGLVVDVQTTSVAVTVRDTESKPVPAALVKLKLGTQPEQTATTDNSGIATFPQVGSNVVGQQTLVVKMGPSDVPITAVQTITFVIAPDNFGTPLGMNLMPLTDFTSQDLTTDLFLGGRGVNIDLKVGGAFNAPALHDLDADGYQKTCTTLQTINYVNITNKNRPAIRYVCLYDGGDWAGADATQKRMTGAVTEISNVQGRILFDYAGSGNMFFQLNLTSADMTAANYVKNVRIIPEALEFTYSRSNIWRPEGLASLDEFKVFRTMNSTQTNNSPLVDWATRVPASCATFSQTRESLKFPGVYRLLGMAYEHLIDLCNRQGSDLWICIPHAATNDYILQLATLVKATLNPWLRVFFEYSNEVWNPLFEQQAYRSDFLFGYYGVTDAWSQVYATRACEAFSIIDSVFGLELQRRVRVLAGQEGNPSMAADITNADVSIAVDPPLTGRAWQHADFYAIGGYAGGSVDEPTATLALDELEAHSIAMTDPITGSIALNVAGSLLPVIIYEGGQHLTKGAPSVSSGAIITLSSQPVDGDQISLTDTAGVTRVFEFDNNAAISGDVSVSIGATLSLTTQALADAIESDLIAAFAAVADTGAGTVTVTQDVAGTAGDRATSEIDSGSVISIVGATSATPNAFDGGYDQKQTEQVVTDAQRDPRMRGIMKDHLIRVAGQIDGSLICPFGHTSLPGPSGAWGYAEELKDWVTPAGPANYKLYGWRDWRLTLGQVLQPSPLGLSTSAVAPGLMFNRRITPSPAVVSSTTAAVTLVESRRLEVQALVLGIVMRPVSLGNSLVLSPGTIQFQNQINSTAVEFSRILKPGPLATSVDLQAAALIKSIVIEPSPISLASATKLVSVAKSLRISPGVVSLALQIQSTSVVSGSLGIITPMPLTLQSQPTLTFYAGRTNDFVTSLRVADEVTTSLKLADFLEIKVK